MHVLALFTPERYPATHLPVVSLTCFVCQREIPADRLNEPDVAVSRIDGDSANGYEAYHVSCCVLGDMH